MIMYLRTKLIRWPTIYQIENIWVLFPTPPILSNSEPGVNNYTRFIEALLCRACSHKLDSLWSLWRSEKLFLKSIDYLLSEDSPPKSLVKDHIHLNGLWSSTWTIKSSMKETYQTLSLWSTSNDHIFHHKIN